MRSRYKIFETEAPYFITSTIVEWLPLFTSMPYFEILRSSFQFSQKKKQLKIYAFVFMDNHVHAILQHPQLSRIMQSIKSYTAFEILKQLKEDKKVWALNVLQNYKLPHKNESRYQVWQEGFHPQLITDDDMLTQKIEYIHWNPVKRGFVDTPEAWRYSSARTFAGEQGVVEVDSLEVLL